MSTGLSTPVDEPKAMSLSKTGVST